MSRKPSQGRSKQAFFNARFTSTISIALVLYLIGVAALTGLVATELSQYVRENIGLSIVLDHSTTEQQIKQLSGELEKAPYIKEQTYISKERAMEEVVKQLGENPEEFLGYNPLLASIEVRLNANYANSDSLTWIEQRMRRHDYIYDIRYQKELMQLVNENIHRISIALLAVALLFLFISFALVNNTVRLMVYSKRFLIHTMRLVGATSHFICRPFILSNMASGVVAALLALAMLGGSIYYLNSHVENLTLLLTPQSLLIVAGVVIAIGVLITALSAYFAVKRYVHMDRDKLYYI